MSPFIFLTDHQYVEVIDDWFNIIDVTKDWYSDYSNN
jgi:hypothetical protein